MAGEDQDESQKTEEPTSKRLEDAAKQGDVARSQEVKHFSLILAATIAVFVLAGPVASGLRTSLRAFLGRPHEFALDPGGATLLASALALDILKILALPFILFVIAAIAGNVVQSKPNISFEKITPKLSKLSLLKGFKRMFSVQTTVEFLKSLLKVVVVAAVVIWLVVPEKARLASLMTLQPIEVIIMVGSLALRMMVGVLSVLGFIAAADFLFQKFQHQKRQRMTKQEVRDEHKQLEGDPTVKARLRQIRSERARKRMMASVPEADVVITNPTHFAVALKYDQMTMDAPRLVAKGADLVAFRIRELAGEHKVPIVENPPLARALHATVDIDEEIPSEHYKAVAEVIGYVMRLKGGGAGPRPAGR